MKILKIKEYSAYEINRVGLTFKLKCFKIEPNGKKIKLCGDMHLTIKSILTQLFEGHGEDNNVSFNVLNLPDDCDSWDEVTDSSAQDGFYYDQLVVSFIEAEDCSLFNNRVLIEKGRYFADPITNYLHEVKTDIYLINLE